MRLVLLVALVLVSGASVPAVAASYVYCDNGLRCFKAPCPSSNALNLATARLHSLSKDTPARQWWNAQPLHPAVYRVLKIDAKEPAATFAALPFRLARIDDQHAILVALPCPRTLGPVDPDWLAIETVLRWDPVADTVTVLGDPASDQLVGIAGDTIYGQPFAFFRAYAEARAQFAIRRRSIPGAWHVKPQEPDLTPGLLLVGDPDKVHWPLQRLSDDLAVIGADAKRINSAMLRQARVPRARQAQLRSAA